MKLLNSLQSKTSLIFVLLLLTLLPTLAVLQYRWLGQISTDERERMQASLQTAANNFASDFDREITRIYFIFEIIERKPQEVKTSQPNEPTSVNSAESYGEAYQKWLSTTNHPKLIKELYFVNQGALNEKGLEFLKFDSQTNKFQPSNYPKELTKLKEALSENSGNDETSKANKQIKIQGFFPIDSKTPALVISCINPGIFPRIDPSKPNTNFLINLNLPIGYIVVLLDDNYIQKQWLPSLTNQYFATGNQLDYFVAVVNNNTEKSLIYQSSQQFNKEQLANCDVKKDFFSLRPDEMDKFFFVNVKTTDKEPINFVQETKVESIENKQVKKFEKHSQHTTISIIQTHSTNDSVPPPQVIKMFGKKPANSEITSGSWQLVVKHQSGSLDIAVNSIRKRNLAISFSILILLAISMGMVLISTRRAESLAKQQMEFVAGVSHELRTPLAVICSAGENLADGVVSNFDQVKRYGGLVKSEGRRLSEMVEQILEFAGWQSHRKTYNLQPTSVEEVINNSIFACKTLITETNFQVTTSIDNDLPLVTADRAALQRAVQNLITNAVKYSKQSNELQILASFHSKNSQVEIKVIDKGIGISPKELPHIFEPFYRGKEAVDAQIHGSGLGLSLVKQIVTACGGKITVSSVVNQGSTFVIYLPISKQLQTKLDEINEAKEIYE